MPRLDVTQCEGSYLRVRVPLMVVNGGGADENNFVSYVREQGKTESEQGVARRNIGITDVMYDNIKHGGGAETRRYVCTFVNAAGGTSLTIPANAHNCGKEVMVQCKVKGDLANMDTYMSNGDIVIRWGNASLISSSNPLVVSIIGMGVDNVPFGS